MYYLDVIRVCRFMCLNFDEYYAILRYCDQQDCAKARYVIAEIQSTRYRNRKQSRLMVDGRVLACVCDRAWSVSYRLPLSAHLVAVRRAPPTSLPA